MNAHEAIEKIKQMQKEMMKKAEEMAKRADKLKAISVAQDNGYNWYVQRVDLNDDQMKANRIQLICADTGAKIDAVLVHPPPITIGSDDEEVELSVFIGGEEE
tara:strand:- start:545 stop:853 length:309 start_codon:yes stop_codon:yes gene_type:complete